MLRILRNKKGQNTAEYAILIGLVIAAAIGIQTYVKRGMQARSKDAGDDFYTGLTGSGDWASISNTAATASGQYEMGNLSSKSTQAVLEDAKTEDMTKEGSVTRDTIRRTKQASGDYQKQDY